mmetsp:Transcript_44742/g.145385  ORF Transcript_44742/g.145385 Transcript_44742/m.145385 type:complete len:238 (+) Transcript_44742:688-1401(+)
MMFFSVLISSSFVANPISGGRVPEKPLQFSLFQSLLLILPQLELSSRSISSSSVAIPIVGGMVPERPALLAETFSSVPERKREGGKVPEMLVCFILSRRSPEAAEARATGSVPETAVRSTSITLRDVRSPSCAGSAPRRPWMLPHSIWVISPSSHETNSFSQHGIVGLTHDRPPRTSTRGSAGGGGGALGGGRGGGGGFGGFGGGGGGRGGDVGDGGGGAEGDGGELGGGKGGGGGS